MKACIPACCPGGLQPELHRKGDAYCFLFAYSGPSSSIRYVFPG